MLLLQNFHVSLREYMHCAGQAAPGSAGQAVAASNGPKHSQAFDFDIARILAFLLPRCADPVEQVRVAATHAVEVGLPDSQCALNTQTYMPTSIVTQQMIATCHSRSLHARS